MKHNYDAYMMYESNFFLRYTVQMEVRMKAAVDAAALTAAAQRAITRYPYLSVEAVMDETGALDFVPNHRPIAVLPLKRPTSKLGSEEVGRHHVFIEYQGNTIVFNFNHSIVGGQGAFPWIQTTLFEYVQEAFGQKLDPEGVRMVGTPLIPGEDALPDLDALPKAKSPYEYHGKPGYSLIQDVMTLVESRGQKSAKYYTFDIPAKEILSRCGSSDASPTALVCVLAFQMLMQVLPEEAERVVALVAMNCRNGLGCPNTYRNVVRTCVVGYDRRIRDWPMEKLGTITRGQIFLAMNDEDDIDHYRKKIAAFDKVDEAVGFEEKVKTAVREDARPQGKLCTYSVSYVGKTDWGSVTPYIDGVYSVTDGTLMLEINAVGDKFCICFIQAAQHTRYYDAFKQVLEREGIPYTTAGPFDRHLPMMEIPKPQA